MGTKTGATIGHHSRDKNKWFPFESTMIGRITAIKTKPAGRKQKEERKMNTTTMRPYLVGNGVDIGARFAEEP